MDACTGEAKERATGSPNCAGHTSKLYRCVWSSWEVLTISSLVEDRLWRFDITEDEVNLHQILLSWMVNFVFILSLLQYWQQENPRLDGSVQREERLRVEFLRIIGDSGSWCCPILCS